MYSADDDPLLRVLILFESVEFMSLRRTYRDLTLDFADEANDPSGRVISADSSLRLSVTGTAAAGVIICARVTVVRVSDAPRTWLPDDSEPIFSLSAPG